MIQNVVLTCADDIVQAHANWIRLEKYGSSIHWLECHPEDRGVYRHIIVAKFPENRWMVFAHCFKSVLYVEDDEALFLLQLSAEEAWECLQSKMGRG